MKGLFNLLAFAATALAHSQMTHFHINGVPDPSCVRQAQNTNPLKVLSSNDMACNIVPAATAKKCTVKGGDNVAFEWRVDARVAPADYPLKDGTIPVGVTDDSHKGPCAVYMKKVDNAATAVGAGDGWFKVSDSGLEDGVFCTDRLRLANLPQPGVIPMGIAPGDYLMRAELLTLNNAGPVNVVNGVQQGGEPQFYVGCVQVTVEGTTGDLSPSTVSIPGYLTMDSPGLLFNIWASTSGTYSNYPVVGPPALAVGPANTPVVTVSAVKTTSSTTKPTSSTKPTAPATPVQDDEATVPTLPPTPSGTDEEEGEGDQTFPTQEDSTTNVAPTTAPTGIETVVEKVPCKTNVLVVTATTLITLTSTVPAGPTPVAGSGEEHTSTKKKHVVRGAAHARRHWFS